jgi:hypothetical protein
LEEFNTIIQPFGIFILLKISQPLVAVPNPIATAIILSCGSENISLALAFGTKGNIAGSAPW